MTTISERLEKFFDSPANRTGLVLWAGTAAAAAMQWYTTKAINPVDVVGVLMGLAKIVLPDNSITSRMLLKAGVDIQAALKNPDSIGLVLADGATIVAAAKPSPLVTPPGGGVARPA
jgi:hypothetical protein